MSTLAAVGQLTSGLLLVLLAHALRRRKRRAWRAVVVLLPTSAALHLLHRHELPTALIALVLLGLILFHRREFYAKADPRTRLRALASFLGLGGLSVLLGLLVVSVHPSSERRSYTLPQRLEHVLYGLFGVEGPVGYTSVRVADLVGYSLGALGLLTALTSAWLALRPETPEPELTAEDESCVRALLDRDGARDSRRFRSAARQERGVLPLGQGGDRLPGGLGRHAGLGATRSETSRPGPVRSTPS